MKTTGTILIAMLMSLCGCKTPIKPMNATGAIPYIASGFERQYAVDENTKIEHNGEIVLVMFNF